MTFLDEAFGYGPKRESLEAMLPHCDYFMPSIDDLQAIYPNSSARELADPSDRHSGAGAAWVIKMGAKGCFVAYGTIRARKFLPTPPTWWTPPAPVTCWDAGIYRGALHAIKTRLPPLRSVARVRLLASKQ